MILHAGLIGRLHAGAWRGVLIEGPSGSGKSDLALRALGDGWRLVADDRTLIWVSGGRLFGRAAPPLGGLIEVRGVGVLPEPAKSFCAIDLAVTCVAEAEVERMPEFQQRDILGLSVPHCVLFAHEASAPAKLARALCRLGLP